MGILVFIVLVSVFGGLFLTYLNKPIRNVKNNFVESINDSFEEEKESRK